MFYVVLIIIDFIQKEKAEQYVVLKYDTFSCILAIYANRRWSIAYL